MRNTRLARLGTISRLLAPIGDGRDFILDDDGGAGDGGTQQQIAAFVDRNLDELTGLWVAHRAAARRLGV